MRIPADAVDGMDVLAVEAATREAVDVVRARQRAVSSRVPDLPLSGPLDVRCGALSDKEEVEQWKQRDPIALFQQQLRAERAARLTPISTASKPRSRPRLTRPWPLPKRGRGSRWRI